MDDSTRKIIMLNAAELLATEREDCSVVSSPDGTHIEIAFSTGVGATFRIVGDAVSMALRCDSNVPEGAQPVYIDEARQAVGHALFKSSMKELGLQP